MMLSEWSLEDLNWATEVRKRTRFSTTKRKEMTDEVV